jgi:hypothetical protein
MVILQTDCNLGKRERGSEFAIFLTGFSDFGPSEVDLEASR